MMAGILTALSGPASAQGRELAVGAPHPDFILPRLGDGKPVSLSQFRGKKVLLIQFASW